MRSNIRRSIRKSEKNNITIDKNPQIEDFITLVEKTFKRQNKTLPYPSELLGDIYKETQKRNCSALFLASDNDGHFHAGSLIIWDAQTAYYLAGGADEDLRSSGGASLTLWSAIQYAANVTQSFDFEGSMIEPVERFFRGFGAIQTPYLSITKTPSKILRLKDFLKTIRH
jgi:lipid II:glycine glycyltransferase (peptidoglycan interpeptide bridge formation enzyme)